MTDKFNASTYLSQVRKLRTLAVDVLKQYPLKNYELKFINHGENATFKVLTKKKNFLLRIHCRSHRTKAAFLEELRWLDSLSRKTNIPVQRPFLSKQGELIVYMGNSQMGHSRYCNLLQWQEGYIQKKKNPHTFFKVGKLIGELQRNTIPSKHRFYWDAKGLMGRKATLGGLPALAKEFPKYTEELESLRSFLYKKIKNYERKNPDKLSLIHADLHFGNMIWNKGIIGPIDFDDCGLGLELYDIAVTLAQSGNDFKKVGKKQSLLNKEALLKGYSIHKQLTTGDIEAIPYFVAARELLMIGWLFAKKDNPELANYLRQNLPSLIRKTHRYIVQADNRSYF